MNAIIVGTDELAPFNGRRIAYWVAGACGLLLLLLALFGYCFTLPQYVPAASGIAAEGATPHAAPLEQARDELAVGNDKRAEREVRAAEAAAKENERRRAAETTLAKVEFNVTAEPPRRDDRVQRDRKEFNRDSQRQQRHAEETGQGAEIAAHDLGNIYRDKKAKRDDVIDFNQNAPRPEAQNAQHPAVGGLADELALMQKKGEVLRSLPVGKIFLKAPAKMRVGETRRVEATVGIDLPETVLQKSVRPGDQKAEGVARLSSQMAATLVGETFKITSLSPEQQDIAAGFPTVWSWNVEATEHGEQLLEATLYAMLPNRQRVDSYVQNIRVEVRPATWGEWFDAFGREFDVAKSIVVALFGLATLVAGWFGISFAFRAKKSAPEV
jgi:hypothetical protein